ncbi:MAG: bifunctional diaminohydroxyphosphoribosylaminopyrimidine deaminase/5-amino-6-(5-phosphoribosylamino)uracil reductase RibD [Candidatus Omnitrophica bacterium]|nr:bifunctional diaminohydroxyphosphoribosylaminopyrimidine deaminase/5-amino-6-(5-phosphoribosylamino)uracil reductase RibD [Candidatus Omnitrophota bacterium]
MTIDERYMRIAIDLAKKAEGKVSPNPIVGAVIVRNGLVIGRGYHKGPGLPHAEINALRLAGSRAKGASLYISLEPCDHFGRTPPCTAAIIKSGIKKVVVGMKDPNPINNGRGIQKLRKAGIKVIVGVLKEEARSINKPYIKFITNKVPYVTVKVAQSLDGKIATKTGDSRWITQEDSRRYVHQLRSSVDAVMVGVNTVIKDDPLLISRLPNVRQPMRIVVDGQSKTPSNAKIFSKVKKSPLVIVTRKRSLVTLNYEKQGAEVLIAKGKGSRIALKDLFKILAKRGIVHILVEGGGELIASLIEERLADRFLFFIAPKIIGGRDAITSVEGSGIKTMGEVVTLKNMTIKRFLKDILIEAEA